MKLHLQMNVPPFRETISYSDKLLFMGSCFSEEIGEKFIRNKFNCLINPNGILFNPESIANALLSYLHNDSITDKELVHNNNLWHHFSFHGKFSSESKISITEKINKNLNEAGKYLKTCNKLLISFGTAQVYEHIASGKVVANCHKFSGSMFNLRMLTAKQIIEKYEQVLQQLFTLNNNLSVYFTVSPVRYLKQGAIQNNISKSSLIQAVHVLVSNFSNAYYFPAYELVTDDLRDYRFYKVDMVHPNELAVNYVWEKVKESLVSANDRELLSEIEKINLSISHRPIHPGSDEQQKFKINLLKKIEEIEKRNKHIRFSEEKKLLV